MQSTKTAYKVDLHTHSIISHDGGIRADEYEKVLMSGKLDCIAITDHNEIRFARIMQNKHGDKIIVGEEITTKDGEIIGLFLKEKVPPGMSAEETVRKIHNQGGIVYIPHPFETFRKGVQKSVLEKIHSEIDIIEVWNGRGVLRGKPKDALEFANKYALSSAASSDAHVRFGLGKTFSNISEMPTRETVKLLLASSDLEKRYAPFYTLFFPTINRLKNKIVLTND